VPAFALAAELALAALEPVALVPAGCRLRRDLPSPRQAASVIGNLVVILLRLFKVVYCPCHLPAR